MIIMYDQSKLRHEKQIIVFVDILRSLMHDVPKWSLIMIKQFDLTLSNAS